MKNFKLLLGAAVIFAVGSAFTASNKAVAGEYVLQGSTYVLKSTLPPGHCEQSQNICDYTKTNPSGNNTDPANFTPNQRNASWISE
ncbi:DUF6520 family protein [Chryseobacterium sp. DT-3]|uniref:DUF6520 family protein n=1 Tax=Chryseobacterium sp. DT-3 TaxID=3396164 RepID=UPI003F1AA5AE